MSALLAVPTAVPAASIPVSAPPFPLSAAAAGGGPAVVAVLLVPFSCRNRDSGKITDLRKKLDRQWATQQSMKSNNHSFYGSGY